MTLAIILLLSLLLISILSILYEIHKGRKLLDGLEISTHLSSILSSLNEISTHLSTLISTPPPPPQIHHVTSSSTPPMTGIKKIFEQRGDLLIPIGHVREGTDAHKRYSSSPIHHVEGDS